MRNTLLVVTAMTIAAATITAQSPQPRFRSTVDLLVVSTIVRNADNALTRGLTQDDFELYEDGKPVSIATFAEANSDSRTSIDDGRFVVLLLDDLATSPVYTTRIKQVAHGFADRMGPKDVMSVLYLNGGKSVTTQIRGEVHKAIDQMGPIGNAVLSPVLSRGGKEQHAIQTIGSLANQLARVGHRRKVVVCIGPTAMFNPTPGVGSLRADVAQTVRDTSRANVTTYVVDPLGLSEKPGLSTRPIDAGGLPDDGPGTISKGAGFHLHNSGFAYETGGLVFANTNTFEPVINQVWEESGNYYLLGYEPAKRDNKHHTIEVRVKKPVVQVRARRTRG